MTVREEEGLRARGPAAPSVLLVLQGPGPWTGLDGGHTVALALLVLHYYRALDWGHTAGKIIIWLSR